MLLSGKFSLFLSLGDPQLAVASWSVVGFLGHWDILQPVGGYIQGKRDTVHWDHHDHPEVGDCGSDRANLPPPGPGPLLARLQWLTVRWVESGLVRMPLVVLVQVQEDTTLLYVLYLSSFFPRVVLRYPPRPRGGGVAVQEKSIRCLMAKIFRNNFPQL